MDNEPSLLASVFPLLVLGMIVAFLLLYRNHRKLKRKQKSKVGFFREIYNSTLDFKFKKLSFLQKIVLLDILSNNNNKNHYDD